MTLRGGPVVREEPQFDGFPQRLSAAEPSTDDLRTRVSVQSRAALR